MPLTSAQDTTLKNDILADPVLGQLASSSDAIDKIIAAYKATATPNYTVWRNNVSQDEIMQNGFDWTRVDNLSVGKARIWEWLFNNQSRSFNPSKLNVRAGIDATWSAAGDAAVRAAVYVHCKKLATRLEALFATGTGTDAAPGTMTVTGTLGYDQVRILMGW